MHHVALAVVILIAVAWRINNVSFGLPSLFDPDEPMFMLKAVEILQKGTLNPHWFGHPGTTTIYLLALVDVAVVGSGVLSGGYPNVEAFVHATYADPGLLFIPARLTMALLGTACVGLTYVVSRRLWGPSTALLAASLLAVNGLHIAWSQVIRTDIHASFFMLISILFALRIVERGRWRDYLLAGLFAGFAIATKWPAAAVFSAVIGAVAGRIIADPTRWLSEVARLACAGAMVVAGMFVASPFLFLDWPTVLSDLSGEGRPFHLGHTGNGFIANLAWYLRFPIAGSMGWLGLALSAAGAVLCAYRPGAAKWTLLTSTAAFLAMISAQHLIWTRWVLPVLPMLCMFTALAVTALARRLAPLVAPAVRPAGAVAIAALALLPSVLGARAQAIERVNDTRAQAADWAIANIPAGSTVVVEHPALKLRAQPWHFLFPFGTVGCVDALKLLDKDVGYDEVRRDRSRSAIVDLGNVAPARIASCRADYAILSYYDLYGLEATRFPQQVANYRSLLAGGHTVALFNPEPGKAGGPVVRIVLIPR